MIVSGAEKVLSLDSPEGFPGLKLYGPALELRVEKEDFGRAGEKIISLLPPLLGCAVLGDQEAPEDRGTEKQGGFRFRAAATANMLFRPLPAGFPPYSFSWKIGKLHWLPPCRANSRLFGEEG
jgi:hypothetical protein